MPDKTPPLEGRRRAWKRSLQIVGSEDSNLCGNHKGPTGYVLSRRPLQTADRRGGSRASATRTARRAGKIARIPSLHDTVLGAQLVLSQIRSPSWE